MSARNLILLAEDDRNDAFFLRRAFMQAGVSVSIVDVRNGQQAMNYLTGEALYSDRTLFPLPTLVVVDLKMPLSDGFKLLEWLQKHPEISKVPVVVLSSSDFAQDISKARELGARDYFIKPLNPAELIEVVRGITQNFLS
jgi:DNA-binding response OmpR family regulator